MTLRASTWVGLAGSGAVALGVLLWLRFGTGNSPGPLSRSVPDQIAFAITVLIRDTADAMEVLEDHWRGTGAVDDVRRQRAVDSVRAVAETLGASLSPVVKVDEAWRLFAGCLAEDPDAEDALRVLAAEEQIDPTPGILLAHLRACQYDRSVFLPAALATPPGMPLPGIIETPELRGLRYDASAALDQAIATASWGDLAERAVAVRGWVDALDAFAKFHFSRSLELESACTIFPDAAKSRAVVACQDLYAHDDVIRFAEGCRRAWPDLRARLAAAHLVACLDARRSGEDGSAELRRARRLLDGTGGSRAAASPSSLLYRARYCQLEVGGPANLSTEEGERRALEFYERAVALGLRDPAALTAAAETHVRLARMYSPLPTPSGMGLDRAMQLYELALAQVDGYTAALAGRALTRVVRAERDDGGDTDGVVELARAQADLDEAKADVGDIPELIGTELRLRFAQARGGAAAGVVGGQSALDAAKTILERAAARGWGGADVAYWTGLYQMALARRSQDPAMADRGEVEAIQAFRAALAADGRHFEAAIDLARLLRKRSDVRSAVGILEAAITEAGALPGLREELQRALRDR